jgi:hypothetical protein
MRMHADRGEQIELARACERAFAIGQIAANRNHLHDAGAARPRHDLGAIFSKRLIVHVRVRIEQSSRHPTPIPTPTILVILSLSKDEPVEGHWFDKLTMTMVRQAHHDIGCYADSSMTRLRPWRLAA